MITYCLLMVHGNSFNITIKIVFQYNVTKYFYLCIKTANKITLNYQDNLFILELIDFHFVNNNRMMNFK